MRKFSIILLLLLPGSICAQTQELRIDPTRVYENSNGILFELKPRPSNPSAQYYYIEKEYRPGDIYLKNGNAIRNLPMRYDIMRNRMEIVFEQEIKVLYASRIDSFQWFNTTNVGISRFTRCKNYPVDPDMKGFLQILADGPLTLASYTYLKVYPATSSVALSGSHREHNIFKKEDFFIIKGQEILGFPKKRKQAMLMMADHKDQIKRFIRSQGLVFSRKQDLVRIFKHYNSLKSAS
ncbi:MAG: hypothetical protein OER04_01125 [Cyclobacteriaceae bacterium]|nr:hypothetical protein [Cyclobacteriaceae bacterium]